MEMDSPMTCTAKGDEILFHIASQKTAGPPMMDFEMVRTPASLASPAIALEHLLAKPLVRLGIQSQPRLS